MPCRDVNSLTISEVRSTFRRFEAVVASSTTSSQPKLLRRPFKVAGLDAGADDYLVKPFELQEVAARLKVLAGRGRRRSSRELKVGGLTFNQDTLNVSREGKEIYLNPIGLKLLHCLMEASPNVVSRAELETEVWGEEMPDSDSLRVHIHSLRSAIDKPFASNMIQTRHGIGYRLVEPDALSS